MTSEEPITLGAYPEKDHATFGYSAARTALDATASATLIPGASFLVGTIAEKLIKDPCKKRDEWF